jgi:predicted Zn-dependent protease
MDRLKELAALTELARDRGAVASEVLLEEREGVRLWCEKGRIEKEEDDPASLVTVRVWTARGCGESTGSGRRAAEVMARAWETPPANIAVPASRMEAAPAVVDGDDRRYPKLLDEERAEVLSLAEKGVRQVDRDYEAVGFRYADQRVVRTFVNSRGVRCREAGTRFLLAGTVSSPRLGFPLSEAVEDRAFATVASLPIGMSLARRLADLEGRRATVGGAVRVALPPRTVADLFARLSSGFAAADGSNASSFFGVARSQSPFSPLLHLTDDGSVFGGFRTSGFDDRGVGPSVVTLIRDGRVEGALVGLDDARRREIRPTGHERGGTLQPSNLILRGGSRSINAILAEERTPVVFLDHLRGLDEGLDVRTGILDAQGSGRLMGPRNQPLGVLPYLRIRGRLDEVFRNILDLASDTDRHGYVDAPGMLVDGLTVEDVAG